jgi:hypothetical protein
MPYVPIFSLALPWSLPLMQPSLSPVAVDKLGDNVPHSPPTGVTYEQRRCARHLSGGAAVVQARAERVTTLDVHGCIVVR